MGLFTCDAEHVVSAVHLFHRLFFGLPWVLGGWEVCLLLLCCRRRCSPCKKANRSTNACVSHLNHTIATAFLRRAVISACAANKIEKHKICLAFFQKNNLFLVYFFV